MVSDFDPKDVDPDGNVGPAIALRPGKTMEADDIRWKPLPMGAGQIIRAHVLLTRRLALETDAPGEFSRRRHDRLPKDYPLFPASVKHLERPWDRSGLYEALAGRVSRPPVRKSPWYGVLQREIHPDRVPPRGGTNRLGYSPHTLRRATLQMVREGGRDFCEERRLPFSPEVIASALLDHEIRNDPYGYADLNTLQERERLSRLGAQVSWEMLITDRGARRMKNATAYYEAPKRQVMQPWRVDRYRAVDCIGVQVGNRTALPRTIRPSDWIAAGSLGVSDRCDQDRTGTQVGSRARKPPSRTRSLASVRAPGAGRWRESVPRTSADSEGRSWSSDANF